MREHLKALHLPDPAVDWLCNLYDCAQTFDDYADGDEVPRKALNALIWNTLVAMPANGFFQANSAVLLPVVGNAILKWQASDQSEHGDRHDLAYAWRASYYDVVLSVCLVVHGVEWATENASAIMGLYGETFEQYRTEFPCPAQQ